MAKVKIKNIGRVESSIRKLFDEIRKDQATLVEMAEIFENDVKGFTRSGKSVATNSRFPGLSEKWRDKRDELISSGNAPGEFYLNSSKSNLTFTGKLIDLWKTKINRSQASIELEPRGTHPGYKGGSGPIDAKVLTQYLSDQGRVVFAFSKEFKARLARRFNVLLKRKLRTKVRDF